jgi:hypothetical protein
MLFLQPPFHIIEGVAVFGDHANPRQFYFMPAMPRLTTIFDPAVGREIPQIQLLEFRGGGVDGDLTGGFLTFEVNLGIEQERIDTVAQEIKRINQLRDNPILAPVVVENGTVRLIILGSGDPSTPPSGQPPGGGGDNTGPPRFVVNKNEPAHPALYGDNQAIFSVELDKDGVQLVEASLQGELLQAGVIYSLDFLALRPAFSVSVTADWNRVQTHFDEKFTTDLFFASTEIETVIDKLIEDRAIEINVDSFLPEGEDSGSWVGRRDQAVNDFKDMVIDSFFEPSIEPEKEEQDGWDRFTHTAERLSLLAATGGWGGVAKFSYTKRDMTRIDQKRINLKMNERVTVRRSIYPQATLKGLGRLLRDAQGQIDLSRFVQKVTLDSDWFRKREVTAHGLISFDHDQVDSVTATLTYGTRPETIRLTSGETTASKNWNSIITDGVMQRDVELEYQVNFKDVDTSERPGIVRSGKLTVKGDEYNINPRGELLYFIDDITLGGGLLPWARYPNVLVETRYDDPTKSIHLAGSFMLNEQQPEATWKRFRLSPDPTQSQYEFRVTYFGADNRDIVGDWTTSDQERLVIRDPRGDRRTITVIPAVSWGLVAMVLVELSYVDDVNGVRESQTLSFSDQDKGPKTFEVHLADPEQRLVQFSATILLSDNRVIMIPPSATASSSLMVRSDMLGHRIVVIQPGTSNFAAQGILRLEADLAYVDSNAGLSFQDRFTFQSPEERHLFEFDYAAAENGGYTCLMRTVFASGLQQERDLGTLRGDKVVLPSG